MSPPFPARRLQLFCGFLRFFAPLPPSPILFSFPLSSSPFPSPLQSSLTSPFPSPSHPVFVYGSPPPSPSPFPPRPRSRPRSRPALLRSLPPPFPLLLRPRPLDRPRPRYRLRSHPRLQSHPRPRSLLPAPRMRLTPRYDALVPTPGLANGAVGCSQAPPPVCRDGHACGMRVPTVKQKKITAEDVLLLSLPPNVGNHWSLSPSVCVCVCMRVFIKLNITPQSGPVILVILFHSN